MAASIEQKLDFLLKKIGYVASKTGIAEDSSLSGTKKAPFGESIPSPLVTPSTSIWADSIHVPATPPGSDTSYVKVYLSGSSGHRMTMDPTVSGNRTFIARSTYNNNSTAILGDWVDTSYGPDYIVKVYKGDPNSGGVQLSAAGSGSNDTWFFDYSSGVLNFNGTVVPSGVTSSNIYIVGYRYIGAKGAIPPAGIATFSSLYVSGISTFNSPIDINSNIDVDGHTELDNVNISGITTFQDDAFFGDGDYIQMGDAQDLKIGHVGSYSVILDQGEGNLSIGGDGYVDIMNTALNEYKARFITNDAVELYFDNSKKFETTGYGATVFGTLQSQQLNVSGVSTFVGVGTFNSDLFVAGDLNVIGNVVYTQASATNLVVTGISTLFHLNVDGHTDLDNVSVAGVTTTSGLLDINAGGQANTFKVEDLTNNRVVIAGTGGELEDDANLTFNGSTLAVGVNLDVTGDLDVDGHTNLDNVSVSGVSTFQNDVHLLDNDRLHLGGASAGDNGDLQIYHDGTNSRIVDVGTGSIISQASRFSVHSANDSEVMIDAVQSSHVKLYHHGSEKLATTGYGVTVFGTTQTQQLNVTGIATATAFHTGAEGSAIRVTSNTISGPAEMFIDPAAVGDNTGALRIKGDLFVDGTQTIINSTTIELGDFIVGIATTATTDLLADGAGIRIGPDNTFLYDHTNTSLKSSENLNLASGKTYKIDGTDVLSSTTLGSGVVNSSLTSLGTLLGLTVSGQTTLNTLNVTGVSTFSSANFNGDLTLTDTNADSSAGPELKLYRNSASPADADYLGQIKFAGESDTGVERNYAKITGKILDASNGTEDGIIEIAHIKAGSQNISARFRSDSLQLLNGTNFSVAGNSTFTGNIDANGNLDVDGHTDLDNVSVAGVTTFSSRIVGAATNNVIPFLYSTFEDLPSASTYHGAFAHVHNRGRAYFSHAANWFELINKELNGTVGTGTERYNVGQIDATGSNVTGVSTSATLNVGVGGTVLNASVNNSRVGINSVTPAYALDVVGDINSSTDIKVNGVSIVSSSSGASLDDVVALAIALG